MSTPTDLAECSASQLLALYRSGQASPVLATQAVLDRIDRPADLRALPREQLHQVVDELRAYLLYAVGQCGGGHHQVVECGGGAHSVTWPLMQLTLSPPTQMLPSASRSM